jgi:hypothetical protein
VKIMPPDARLPDEIKILGVQEENVVEENKELEEEVNENAEGTEGEADTGDESGREETEAQ